MFRILFAALLFVSPCLNLFGQILTTDSLQRRINVFEKDLAWAKNLKMTGHVQALWQKADIAGIKSLAVAIFQLPKTIVL